MFNNVKAYIRRSSIIRNSIWSILGTGIGKTLSLIGGVLLARFLGPEIFGEYSWIKQTIFSFSLLASLGLSYISTRNFSRWRTTASSDFVFQQFNSTLRLLGWISAISIVILFSFYSTPFGRSLLPFPISPVLACFILLLFVLRLLGIVLTGVISGLGSFKELAQTEFISSAVFTLGVLVLLISPGLGIALLVIVISLMVLVMRLMIKIPRIIKSINSFPTNINEGNYTKRELLTSSVPLALQEMVYSLTQIYIVSILGLSSSIAELAIYTVALQWFNFILFIPVILRNVFLHSISSKQHDAYHKTIYKMALLNLVFCGLVSVAVYLNLDLVISLYGIDYIGLQDSLVWFLLASIFAAVGGVISQVLIAADETWGLLLIRIVRDLGLLVWLFFNFKHTYATSVEVSKSFMWSNVVFLFLLILSLIKKAATNER